MSTFIGQCNAETASGAADRLDRRAGRFCPRRQPRAREGVRSSRCNRPDRERNRSRIVVKLADGIVTTAAADADCVVNRARHRRNCAAAHLAERAEALVAVADPAFRAELRRAVRSGCFRRLEAAARRRARPARRSSAAIDGPRAVASSKRKAEERDVVAIAQPGFSSASSAAEAGALDRRHCECSDAIPRRKESHPARDCRVAALSQ